MDVLFVSFERLDFLRGMDDETDGFIGPGTLSKYLIDFVVQLTEIDYEKAANKHD